MLITVWVKIRLHCLQILWAVRLPLNRKHTFAFSINWLADFIFWSFYIYCDLWTISFVLPLIDGNTICCGGSKIENIIIIEPSVMQSAYFHYSRSRTPTIFSGLIFCIFVMCNPQSENSCDMAISVKLPKFVYSQLITIGWYLVFANDTCNNNVGIWPPNIIFPAIWHKLLIRLFHFHHPSPHQYLSNCLTTKWRAAQCNAQSVSLIAPLAWIFAENVEQN